MTCRDHPTAAEAWTESRTDATAAEPVLLSDFSKNIFQRKYLRPSPDLRKYFSKRIYWHNTFCFFTRICLHWVPVFKKIFSKKTFPSYSLFSENISQENILTSLTFSENIFLKKWLPAATSTAPSCSPSATTASSAAATLLIPHNIFDIHNLSQPEFNFQQDIFW